MNSTNVQPELSLPKVSKLQSFFFQISDAIDQWISNRQQKAGIDYMMKLLKKYGQLQFQLLEIRAFQAPAYVLRKTGFEPVYLTLNQDQSITEFDDFAEVHGSWQNGNHHEDLHLKFSEKNELANASAWLSEKAKIRSFVDNYLIVDAQTENGSIQKIYALYQKGI